MQEDKKVPQGLIFDDVFAFAGGRRDPTAMPNASKPMAQKDKLKNVTPKEPVQLELPFEEFKNAK